jgi:hypothetical protein
VTAAATCRGETRPKRRYGLSREVPSVAMEFRALAYPSTRRSTNHRNRASAAAGSGGVTSTAPSRSNPSSAVPAGASSSGTGTRVGAGRGSSQAAAWLPGRTASTRGTGRRRCCGSRRSRSGSCQGGRGGRGCRRAGPARPRCRGGGHRGCARGSSTPRRPRAPGPGREQLDRVALEDQQAAAEGAQLIDKGLEGPRGGRRGGWGRWGDRPGGRIHPFASRPGCGCATGEAGPREVGRLDPPASKLPRVAPWNCSSIRTGARRSGQRPGSGV